MIEYTTYIISLLQSLSLKIKCKLILEIIKICISSLHWHQHLPIAFCKKKYKARKPKNVRKHLINPLLPEFFLS